MLIFDAMNALRKYQNFAQILTTPVADTRACQDLPAKLKIILSQFGLPAVSCICAQHVARNIQVQGHTSFIPSSPDATSSSDCKYTSSV